MINPTPDLIQRILRDRQLRIALVRESHVWFFHLYLAHYVKCPPAPFHEELFRITENDAIKSVVIVAFRGSAKSTIMTLSYALWATIGRQEKKFVLLLSQTQNQARQLLMNIKRELESNDLLRNDFGALEEETDQWGRDSLVLPRYKARIMAASTEQSIRGSRHWEHRPDLIICDDVEDLNSVKTREGRNKTYSWLTGEVIPAGDQRTKFILIGNLLHEDSLLMRLKRGIEAGTFNAEFRWYPIVDENGGCLWPGKYPTPESLEALRKTIPSESAWLREYMLRIITDQEQVVHPSWIHYYDTLPSNDEKLRYVGTGIDLAISDRDTADYTSMVTAKVYGWLDEMRVYVLPNPVNEHLDFPATVERAKLVSNSHTKSHLYVEDVGYQLSLVQELTRQHYKAEGVKVHGQDKRARLALVTHLIQNGQVLFPRHGCEELIAQLTGFGVESHDDLADAFAILMHKVIEKNSDKRPGFWWLCGDPYCDKVHGGYLS